MRLSVFLPLFWPISVHADDRSAPPVPDIAQPAEDASDWFSTPEGFVVERLYNVPQPWGSWVALTKLPGGDLAAADQYGGLYRISIDGADTSARPLDVAISGAHAILWHGDSLYVTVTERGDEEKGVYRARDEDGDGSFEKVERLMSHRGGGEHGAHALVPSPDGEWIYFISGNHTPAPDVGRSWVPKVWGEDHLLPRNPDGLGHARDMMAPGGWIVRFRPDGSGSELVAIGFRNAYDMAFNDAGDLFAYDGDMEWDLGMPWYRPTRLCHVVPGAEFGWRNGTGKWPDYYEDSLGAVVEFGPGSPTGVVSGRGAAFPAKYQKAIFCFDWTFATIYAVHLEADGAGYRGDREEFLTGEGLPLTDGVVGDDGALYFATGGRRTASALWRIRYAGPEDVSPVPYATKPGGTASLKSMLGEAPGAGADAAEKLLGSDDRTERFVARVTLENAGADRVRAAGAEGPMARINLAIALSRVGAGDDRKRVMDLLLGIDWASLSADAKLSWLRACSLAFIRLGDPDEAERGRVLAMVDASFPADDPRVGAELCRLLCHLRAPDIVRRTLQEMAEPNPVHLPDWARLIGRNKGYGKDLEKTLRTAPPVEDIHHAYCLRVVEGPWTEGQRRQLMEWYAEVEGREGGKSYGRFLTRMKNDTLDRATEKEREMVEGWGLEVARNPFANLPRAEGPGRDWKVGEVAALAADLDGADPENGRRMFQAALCMACHRVGGEGGGSGPDLSTVAGRFTPEELAVAIVDPSKEVSDQFQFSLITRKDGSTVYGKVIDEKDLILIVATSALDMTQTIEIERGEIESIEPSAISPMPPGLITPLSERELRDMLAWLLRK